MQGQTTSPDIALHVDPETRREQHPGTSSRLQQHWPEPLTAKEWDARYPGVLDGVAALGAAANIIMQLALLPVGHGVAESKVESGAIFKHPIKRARTTFTYLAVAMLGTTQEKIHYRKAVNRSHAQVRSDANSKVKYNAFDPELQLWVAACLYWGFTDSMARFRGPLSRAEQEAFYQLAKPLGTTLQVRDDMWPADLDAFEAYWEKGLNNLQVDDDVRAFLNALTDLKFLHPLIRYTLGPFNRFVTTGFLPPQVRAQMQFEWSEQDERRFNQLLAALSRVNRLLPRIIRQFPFNTMLWDFRRRVRKGLPLV